MSLVASGPATPGSGAGCLVVSSGPDGEGTIWVDGSATSALGAGCGMASSIDLPEGASVVEEFSGAPSEISWNPRMAISFAVGRGWPFSRHCLKYSGTLKKKERVRRIKIRA